MANKSAKGNAEEIIQGFNRLRTEQRQLAAKIAELEQEVTEHSMVLETMSGVDESRRCFRMVGGVLVERTVREVKPALTLNRDQLVKLVETLKTQLLKKTDELTSYQEKHQIRIQQAPAAVPEEAAAPAAAGVLA